VAAELRAEQVVGQQFVRGSANRRGAEQQVHHGQERPLEQEREAAGEHARAVFRVQRFELAGEMVGLLSVALPERLNLRGDPGLRGLAAHRVVAEGQHEQPDGDGERGDGHGDGQAAGHGREQGGQGGDKVIRGVDGDAKQTEHDGQPSSGPERTIDGWRRPR
jgi:hypothetical protein